MIISRSRLVKNENLTNLRKHRQRKTTNKSFKLNILLKTTKKNTNQIKQTKDKCFIPIKSSMI